MSNQNQYVLGVPISVQENVYISCGIEFVNNDKLLSLHVQHLVMFFTLADIREHLLHFDDIILFAKVCVSYRGKLKLQKP